MSEETWFDSHWMQDMYLFSTAPAQIVWHTQPPIQWVLEALSPGVKQVGHEGDCSLLSSTEVKNKWTYNSTFPMP